MKSLNKKLYFVIVVCLLLMCFSVGAMATTDTGTGTASSTPSTASTSSTGTGDNSVGNNGSGDTSSATEGTGSDGSSDAMGSGDDVSAEDGSSDGEMGDEFTSSDGTLSTDSETTTSYSYSGTTSKNKYYGDIGGDVIDEADTSGWSDKGFHSSLVSAGTTQKGKSKNIADFSNIPFIILCISAPLLLASIISLIIVNKKSFLKASANDMNAPRRKPTASEKEKRKNNHKNRTNVYRPRD